MNNEITECGDVETVIDQTPGQQSRHGPIYFYSPIPSTDTWFREHFDNGIAIAHESREAIESVENTDRIEVVKRYERGFVVEKFVEVPKALRTIALSIVFSLAILFYLPRVNWFESSLATPATTPGPVFGAILIIGIGFFGFLVVEQLRKVFALRAFGHATSLDREDVIDDSHHPNDTQEDETDD